MRIFRRLAIVFFFAAKSAGMPACGAPLVIDVPMARVAAVAFSPGGGQVAVGGLETMKDAPGDGVVALVDAATGKQWSLLRHSGTVKHPSGGTSGSMNMIHDLAYSPDGMLLAVAAELGLKLWNPASGKEVATLLGYGQGRGGREFFGGIPSIAFSPDGKLLAAANAREGRLVMWDVAKREPAREVETMGDGDVAFSHDGALLVTAEHLNRVHLWRAADGVQIGEVHAEMGPLYGTAIDPAGKLVAAVGEGGEKLWKIESDGDGRWRFVDEATLSGYGPIAPVRGVAFSPDGRLLVTYADSGAMLLYDAATRRPVGALLYGGPCAFSPDGKWLAVAETARGQRGPKSRLAIWPVDEILDKDRLAEQARTAATELVRIVASGRPDYDLQPRAMGILGGPQAVAAVPVLGAALGDDKIEKKQFLAMALGRLAANSPEAVAALAKALREDRAADTRTAAARALWIMPREEAAPSVPALAEAALNDESPDVQRAALHALLRLDAAVYGQTTQTIRARRPVQTRVEKRNGKLFYQGRSLEEWIERLGVTFVPNEIFGRPSPQDPLTAIRAMGADAVPGLVEALKSPRWEIRRGAAAGLEALGTKASSAAEPLFDALAATKPEDYTSAGAAADALAGIFKGDKKLPAKLLDLAESDNLAVRLAAARAIGQLDPGDPRGVPALKIALEASTTLPMQRPVMMMGPGFLEQPPVTWLAKTLADDEAPAMHRVSAAVTLARMKDEALKAMPAMIEAVGAKDEAVSQSAASAIKELGPKAIPALREAVKSEERKPVRPRLAATLAALGDDGRRAVAEVLDEKEAEQLWWAGALGAAPSHASMMFQSAVREALEKCGQRQAFTSMQPQRPPAFPRYEQPTALWSAKLLADLDAPRSLRMQAATQLLRARGEEITSTLPALLEALNKETDRTMQSQLANTIQRMGPQAIPAVLAAVDQAPSDEVRRELLRSLSGLGEEGRRELTQQLTNNAEYRKLFDSDSTSSAVRRQGKAARQLSSLERRAISAARRTGRPLTNGNFAQGFEDWDLEGDGKEFHLFPRGGGMALTTFGERGDAVTGRAFQCFKVPRDASSLEFLLHGGSNDELTYVALWNGNQRLGNASARKDNSPFLVSFDLTKQRGAVVTLEIVDKSTDAWGFIGAENFRIVGRQEIKTRNSAPPKFAFDVELRGKQGQVISGRVDTVNEVFVITYWSGPAGKTWTPLQGELPLTLYAYSPDGQAYDVPEDWDGKISGWTFLLPPERDLTSVAWKEGAPSEFWKGASFGWGGLRNSAGKVVTGRPGSDETFRFRYVPMEGNSASDIMFDDVKVTHIEPTSDASE